MSTITIKVSGNHGGKLLTWIASHQEEGHDPVATVRMADDTAEAMIFLTRQQAWDMIRTISSWCGLVVCDKTYKREMQDRIASLAEENAKLRQRCARQEAPVGSSTDGGGRP